MTPDMPTPKEEYDDVIPQQPLVFPRKWFMIWGTYKGEPFHIITSSFSRSHIVRPAYLHIEHIAQLTP